MPQLDPGWFRMDPWAITLLSIIFVVFLAFVIHRAIRVHRNRLSAGREDLVGKTAEVRTSLTPRGMVFIQGEHWAAVSGEGRIESGEEVIVIGVDNLVLSVKKRDATSNHA